MKRIERFVDLDPAVEWEERLLSALADVLESVPAGESAPALAALRGLGVRLYNSRLLAILERLKGSSPSP